MTDLFECARLSGDRAGYRRPPRVTGAITDVTVTPFPYRFGSLPNCRPVVGGCRTRHAQQDVVLRQTAPHPRLSPDIRQVPEETSGRSDGVLPWHFELDMYESGIGDVPPTACAPHAAPCARDSTITSRLW